MRALAFIMVYLFHSASTAVNSWPSVSPLHTLAQALTEGGQFGVPLFFVLSAFLVTHLLLIERERTGTISIRDFIVRRSLRIWPLYYLLIATCGVCVASGIQAPGLVPLWPKALLAYGLFSGDFLHMAIAPTILGPLWSLSIEEKFYLIWPTVLKRLRVSDLRLVATGIIAVGLLSRALSAPHLTLLPFWVFPLNHLDSFGYGILLATLPIGPSRKGSGWWIAFLLGGFGVAQLMGSYLARPGVENTVGLSVSMGIASMIAAVFLYMVRGSESGLLTIRPMRELGKRTYAAYVLHFIPCHIATVIVPNHLSLAYLGAQLVAFTVTLGLARASYRWIESPFLRLKYKFERVASRPV